MLPLKIVYEVTRLLSLVITIWICCVKGGIMKKMMDAWMEEQKSVKAIPIPIPVLIKENSPPPPAMPMMKSKDWIWKLMMLKVMKDHDKPPKCSKKIIVFPSKNKDKGCKHCGDCGNCPCGDSLPPPPELPEEEPDFYGDGGLRTMMGWETFG